MTSRSNITVALDIILKCSGNPIDNLQDIKALEEEMHISSMGLCNFNLLQALSKTHSLVNGLSMWRYVCLSLECLLRLKADLSEQSEEADKLMSVAQQKSARALLERIVRLGLLPNLLPGVDPFSHNATTTESSLSDIEKYECLCVVTLALVDLCHDDSLHSVVIPQFLSPLMCALCQLTMVPLKKSSDTFLRLQRERVLFQKHIHELVTKLFPPLVIKELMVIEGNKNCPKWLKRGVGRLLTEQLHRPRGVLSVVQAVRDAANCAAPTSSAHLESLAQVITSSFDLQNICAQILDLLDVKDSELIRVAVLCIKTLNEKDEKACKDHLLDVISAPLTQLPCSEPVLTQCLQRLHKCFAVPASDFWCLPPHLLRPHIHTVFQIHCRVFQSASHVRSVVEDLMWRFLNRCCEIEIRDVLLCLVLGEEALEIKVRKDVEFVFGDDGGVKAVKSIEREHSLEEFCDGILALLEKRDSNGMIGNRLFLVLVEEASKAKDAVTVDELERSFATLKLLAVLSENEAVQKNLSENPEPTVNFLKSMIDDFLSDKSSEEESILITLQVLSVILNNIIYSKKDYWHIFKQLEHPLSLLKSNTKSVALRTLAEELYEVMMTHGAIKPKQSSSQSHKESASGGGNSLTQSAYSYQAAMQDACDPLLPVRAHGIMELGKLLMAGDKEARAKKDQILCVFQENLKDKDSYLYLSAVEGLATVAAEFPDTVIVSLVEQFSEQSHNPDSRLKVGEALLRVIKLLGELAPVYKTELVNAFLSGTRDDDFLVRTSSLSNLGELCRVLGFRVGTILTEVLMCASSIARSDPSVEVRRAAVMLVYLLLKGLHKDALTVLQDVLLELYHTLKHIYSTDKDDVTRLQAQLALEELNSGTLAFLFPKPQLTKQIFVLDPPS